MTPGTPYEEMLRVVTRRGLIAHIEGSEETWLAERLTQHRDPPTQVKQHLSDGRCLQVSEYRTHDGGLITIQTDITEIERREAARRVGEEKTRSIIDTVIDGIITFDADGSIETFNPVAEAIFGCDTEEVLGTKITDLMAEPFAAEYRERVARFMESDDPADLGSIHEIRGRRRDGATFPLEIALRELRGTWTLYERRKAQRRVFIATLRDISQRTELAQQLQQSQKLEAIGTLAGGIAHDFNNILSIILGYASLVQDELAASTGEVPEGEEMRESLDMVIQAGRRARDLIEQILTFSRHTEQAKRALYLEPIVTEVLKLMRSTLPSTIDIRQQMDSPPSPVMADPSQVHQVLMNLCTNAAHAIGESGGELEVVLDQTVIDGAAAADIGSLAPGRYVRLTVRDNGGGMDKDTVARIFEPFFTTKGIGRGTGLGLAVVHGIVTNHDGAIRVASAPGEGAAFEVLLPCHEGELPPTVEIEEEVTSAQRGRVLFIDDEVALVRMAEKVLTRLGYSVVGQTQSPAALELFRRDPDAFDLIVTDQTMPGLTGDALLGEVRKVRQDIPVVLCTGFNHNLTPEQAKSMGIDVYLMKPLLAGELGRAVGRALERRAACPGQARSGSIVGSATQWSAPARRVTTERGERGPLPCLGIAIMFSPGAGAR